MQMPQYLNDEHMRMYEWNGAGTGIATRDAAAKPRWHASYAVLAVLTSLLVLNGCDTQETAALPGDQFEQSADAQPAYNEAPMDSVEAGAPAGDMGVQPEAVSPVEGGQPLDESAAPVEDTPQQP